MKKRKSAQKGSAHSHKIVSLRPTLPDTRARPPTCNEAIHGDDALRQMRSRSGSRTVCRVDRTTKITTKPANHHPIESLSERRQLFRRRISLKEVSVPGNERGNRVPDRTR